MAEFTETTTKTINCPACDSGHVVKIGKQKGQQRYRCRGCNKDFRAGGKAEGRRMDSGFRLLSAGYGNIVMQWA